MTRDKFIQTVSEALRQVGITPDNKLVLGLSGGADSVALLLALRQLNHTVVAAHCNFGLRGHESDRDQNFAERLCAQLDVPLEVTRFDVPAWQRTHGGSTEMACRQLRYEWFEHLRITHACHAIAIAHHADDQVETFMLNLLRGTGLDGLTGMRPMNNRHIVRPMLGLWRADIEQFLNEHGHTFVTDSTNASNDFTRNRLRNAVIPRLERDFPDARGRILDTMTHLSEAGNLLDYFINQTLRELTLPTSDSTLRIDKTRLNLMSQPDYLLYEILKPYGFTRTQATQAVYAATGSRFDADKWQLWVAPAWMELFEPNSTDINEIHRIDLEHLESLPIRLEVIHSGEPFKPGMVDGRRSIALPLSLASANLILRHRRTADRIAPFGMRGTKLVSDLMTHLRLSPTQKRAAWLVEAGGTVVWVVGYRAARQTEVQPGSRDYIILRVKD